MCKGRYGSVFFIREHVSEMETFPKKFKSRRLFDNQINVNHSYYFIFSRNTFVFRN